MTGRAREYRRRCSTEGLASFTVRVEETDLYVAARGDLARRTRELVARHRRALKEYLRAEPEFGRSFGPVAAPAGAPEIARLMSASSFLTGTGPMASVAGAFAELVGKALLEESADVVVENGGDIFLRRAEPTTVAVWAGASPLSMRLALRLPPTLAGAGVATSSATVGPSYSAGRADAVTVLSPSAAFADGAATALGNLVASPGDFPRVEREIPRFPFVDGVLIIIGKELFAWGAVALESC